jgi:anti-anti-sigma regulatory factor
MTITTMTRPSPTGCTGNGRPEPPSPPPPGKPSRLGMTCPPQRQPQRPVRGADPREHFRGARPNGGAVPAGLALSVERSPTPVVRIAGRLSLDNADLLQQLVLDELADDPIGIVLDVTDLHLDDELGLIMISLLARQAAREHRVRFVLAAASAELGDRLRMLGSSVENFASVPQAQAALR